MAKISKVSPFAPATLPELPPIAGVRLAVAEAGIKGYETNKYEITPEQLAAISTRWRDVIARYGYGEANPLTPPRK